MSDQSPGTPGRLRVGVIGLGHQAEDDHLPGILSSRFTSLAGCCDTDPERLKVHTDRLDVPGFVDPVALLEECRPDFVVLCTPHSSHTAIAKEAITRGVHVLKEKPFAMSLGEGIELRDLARRHGVSTMIAVQRRFNPIYRTVPQLLDEIGRIFFIDGRYARFLNDPNPGWRADPSLSGGGCLIDMGYHLFDLLLWYFGLPQIVTASISNFTDDDGDRPAVEDTASVHIRYDSGIHGTLFVSRFCGPKTEGITVFGGRGSVELTRGAVKRRSPDGELLEDLVRQGSWPTAATNQIDYFARVIRGERSEVGTPEEHLLHLALIEACYRSAAAGQPAHPKAILEEATAG